MEKLAFDRRESAELLSISLRTLDALLATKELRSRRVGRRVLITRDELERFLKSRPKTGSATPADGNARG